MPRTILQFLLVLPFLSTAAIAQPVATTQSADAWRVVDGKWDDDATAPVWKMVAWPGKDLIIASLRAAGLWSSADGGETWHRMGSSGHAPPSSGEACTFVFDPADSNTMWTSGMYGYGVWRTNDGGNSFSQLGDKTHVDGIAVDFTDPQRKTLLIGLHEQEQSIHRSTDGGATWEKIGGTVPAGSAFTSDQIVLDAKTYITNSAGYKRDEKWGIFRSEDAGATWTQVSTEGASGNYTITSAGDIFWPCLWNQHLVKSSDRGKSWARVAAPARGIVVEIEPGQLVALGGPEKTPRLYRSSDAGATWAPLSPDLPAKVHGFTYDAARRTFIAFAEHDNDQPRHSGEIMYWRLPSAH